MEAPQYEEEEVDYNVHVQELEEGLEEVVAQDGSGQIISSAAFQTANQLQHAEEKKEMTHLGKSLKQSQLLNPEAASQIFEFSAASYGSMRRSLG
uniref:Uncharacterized protein n=1 Tax=Glossina pallidipes TaxID=7398 RepID=A0A1A9ZW11_GLOPL